MRRQQLFHPLSRFLLALMIHLIHTYFLLKLQFKLHSRFCCRKRVRNLMRRQQLFDNVKTETVAATVTCP